MGRFYDQLQPKLFSPKIRQLLRDQAKTNSAGYDPWGFDVETTERAAFVAQWFYKHYFRVRVHGLENIPDEPTMFVPNHSGQLPLDGMLIAFALLFEGSHPRLVRGMIERWFPSLPFVGTFFSRCGQVVGDPENCRKLLRNQQSIMVFPEGVRGSGKLWQQRYQLQRFGTGFMRIAQETQTPIVPVAVVGAEETYPSVANLKTLARLLSMPYFPITPFWPALGPLGLVPLPVQIDISFGHPIDPGDNPDESDDLVEDRIRRVQDAIRAMIQQRHAERPVLHTLNKDQWTSNP